MPLLSTIIPAIRSAVQRLTTLSRQDRAVAAYRNAEGRCSECNDAPPGESGVCDRCYAERMGAF